MSTSNAPAAPPAPARPLPWAWIAFGVLMALGLVVLNRLAAAGTWYDDAVLPFILRYVYRYDFAFVALAALGLLLWPSHPLLRYVRWFVGYVVVLYLLNFQMHRYSWFAWPIVVGVLGYAISRSRWFQVADLRREDVIAAARRAAGQWRRYLIAGAAVLLPLIVLFVAFRVAWESFFFLAAVLVASVGVAGAFIALKGGKRPLSLYLRSDPRMSQYFDAIRRLRSPRRAADDPLLANNRLAERNSSVKRAFWGSLFLGTKSRIVGFPLRLLVEQRPLPQLDSRFLEDRLRYRREEAWCDYERARYGPTLTEYRARRASHPKVLEPEGARGHRLHWLALSEALAEYYAFGVTVVGGGTPDWQRAASILGQAAELQLELCFDLRRHKLDDDREAELARHFFDLAAACLERHLEPPADHGLGLNTLAARANHFCASIADATGWRTADANVPLRMALLWTYSLLAELAKDQAVIAQLTKVEDAVLRQFQIFGSKWPIRDSLLQATAFTALCVYRVVGHDRRDGRDRRDGHDVMLMIHSITHAGASSQVDEVLAIKTALNAVQESECDSSRFLFLWGLGYEAIMHRGTIHSNPWFVHRRNAAERYSGGPRRLRLWSLAVEGEAAPPAVAAPPGQRLPAPPGPKPHSAPRSTQHGGSDELQDIG